MDLEEWDAKYKPVTNHLDDNASFDGVMFETYGEELDFVRAQPLNKVWTMVDGDNDEVVIISGYHLVNRIGYFVTENPWEDDISIVVNAGVGDDDDE